VASKRRWLIEGVCGTGKSSLIAALTDRLNHQGQMPLVIDEDESFGELMAELDSPATALCWRLEQVLASLPERLTQTEVCILERFHPSYYAQIPQPELYTAYDRALAELGFSLILLDLPNSALRERSLYRYEREHEDWIAGNISFYGSETQAIEAFQISQERRREYARLTRMPVRIVDTRSQNWQALAEQTLL
jgi:thymidylate kinase